MKIGPFNTSKKELNDIFKAWIAISLAFSLIFGTSSLSRFISAFIISLLTVGLGFLLHELAHKLVAQHYGCFAEFRSFDSMLVIALVFAFFFGIVFAAPGAVMISGPVGKSRNGKISMAGPLMNLILAAIFLINFIFLPVPFLKTLFGLGFLINTWLALFNMIPVWNFDGKKILDWSKLIYALLVAVGFVFFFTASSLGISF
ncbi:MAG: peptidase M50 [Candidatus Woesearchaeota archaeon]